MGLVGTSGIFMVYHTYLVTSKVILGSFGALTIFHDWGVIVRDRKKYFAWL